MYEPLDFKHGIDQLEQAESRGDAAARASILALMLEVFENMSGNLHRDLLRYIAALSRYPDNPVDFTTLHRLHYEFLMDWGSSTYYRHYQEGEKVEFLLPFARRDKARQDGTRTKRRKKINEWIAEAIKRYPGKSRPELWDIAPDWITDQIGRDRFLKRVSAERKKIKK